MHCPCAPGFDAYDSHSAVVVMKGVGWWYSMGGDGNELVRDLVLHIFRGRQVSLDIVLSFSWSILIILCAGNPELHLYFSAVNSVLCQTLWIDLLGWVAVFLIPTSQIQNLPLADSGILNVSSSMEALAEIRSSFGWYISFLQVLLMASA